MEIVAKGFFDILFNLINVFIDAIMTIPNLMLGSLFDGLILSDYITNFYSIINSYIIPTASFFCNIVPPMTWSLIIIYFTLLIGIYSITLSMHYVLKPLRLIKTLIPFA